MGQNFENFYHGTASPGTGGFPSLYDPLCGRRLCPATSSRVNSLWVLDPEIFREINVAMKLSGFRKVMLLRTGPSSDRNTLQSQRPSLPILHSVLGRMRWEKFRTRPEIVRAARWSKCFRLILNENLDNRFPPSKPHHSMANIAFL